MAGIGLQSQLQHRARRRAAGDSQRVVGAQRIIGRAGVLVIEAHRHAIHPEHSLHRAGGRLQEKGLPGQRFIYGKAALDPQVFPFAAPYVARL